MAQLNLKKGTKGYYNLMQAIGSCNRARDLIWQFITISKGGAPIKKEGALLPLIKEVCNLVLSGSNIRCQVSQAENLWPVAFDRSQIEQVIHNLVVNAKEAMSEGGPIRIWLENVSIHGELPDYILEQGEYVRIVIQDEGRGIPEKHLPLLFDPYFSTKERGSQKGMGLGLTTAYSIIKKHGGHIDLASKVGIGTTFYIYLPAVKREK
jgi:signal transduction histidine kinase